MFNTSARRCCPSSCLPLHRVLTPFCLLARFAALADPDEPRLFIRSKPPNLPASRLLTLIAAKWKHCQSAVGSAIRVPKQKGCSGQLRSCRISPRRPNAERPREATPSAVPQSASIVVSMRPLRALRQAASTSACPMRLTIRSATSGNGKPDRVPSASARARSNRLSASDA
jgi:hypothetical protein